jgi:glutamate/aspartate transport system substrate-binding protein
MPAIGPWGGIGPAEHLAAGRRFRAPMGRRVGKDVAGHDPFGEPNMRLVPLMLAASLLAAPAMAAELTGTLQKIKETGTITLGVRESSVPFSYLDDHQKAVGYAVDICGKIVDAVKQELKLPDLKVQIVPVLSSNRIPLMANGTIDLECGSTTNNAERQKQVAFTNTHFLTASRFVSKKAAHLESIDALRGKTVVSTSGTTNIVQLNQVNAARKLDIAVVNAKDHAEAFLMVETGRAVAFVMDDIILSSLVASSKDPSAYVVSTDAFSAAEPYGIMLRRDDSPFKAVVDKATADLYRSPEGKAIYAKWFQAPIPPKGLNLNVPMSAGMKHAYAHPSDNPDPASYVD